MPSCLLREHCASLAHSNGVWLLTYPIASYEYGERVPERIDVTLSIVAENYAGAYKLAKLILKDHQPPSLPEPEVITWQPPAGPVGRHRVFGGMV
jgi:hypothetical protein